MIIFLAEHMRNQGGLFLDLGGGIEEQDSLAGSSWAHMARPCHFSDIDL